MDVDLASPFKSPGDRTHQGWPSQRLNSPHLNNQRPNSQPPHPGGPGPGAGWEWASRKKGNGLQYDSLGDRYRFEREMAIAVFETQDESLIRALKQFLQTLPNPKLVEGVLAQAVCHCAEAQSDSLDWLVDHAAQLAPELYLQPWTRRLIANRLLSQGYSAGQDFCFESGNYLRLTGSAGAALAQACSRGELRLIKRLFVLGS